MTAFDDFTGLYKPAPRKIRQEAELIELRLLEDIDGNWSTVAVIVIDGSCSLASVRAIVSRVNGRLVIETTNSVYAGPEVQR